MVGTYADGVRDGMRLVVLEMVVSSGSFRTGLKHYPICRSERAQQAATDLDALKAKISALTGEAA